MMARIGRLCISLLLLTPFLANGQNYPFKAAEKKDTIAVIKKIGGVNAITVGAIVALGDTSNSNEIQKIDTFSIVGDSLRLSLSMDGEKYKTVFLTGHDKQKADTFAIVSNTLRLSLERDGIPFTGVNLAPYLDNTDGQTLSIAGNNLTISGGNTVVIPNTNYTAGSGINITGTVITNTGDLSSTNELQTFGHAGSSSYTNTLSLGGGSFTLTGGAGITLSHNGSGTTTVVNTGDLSATNELQTYSHSGTTSYTNTLSAGGGSFSITAGSGIGVSHNGVGGITLSSSAGTNIYNSNGSLTANRTASLNGFNLLWNGTGDIFYGISGRVGWFLSSGTPFTVFSNSTTGIQDQATNNTSIGGIHWESYGTGYTQTVYSGFSHGFHTRTNGNTISQRILNCSSGSSAVDRFTVFGNGTVRVQGLPNVSILGTNANGDLIPSSAGAAQTYAHSGTSSYTNTLSLGGGSFTLAPGSGITMSHNGFGTTTISASGGGTGWLTTGNGGTNPASNYVGTTDAQDFVVRTQATEVLRFKVGGLIGQGTTAPNFPYHMFMAGANGFKRESSGTTMRDSWKISTSEFYGEYTTTGVPKPTFKLYGSTNFDGGFFIENDNSRVVFGLNFVRFTSHPQSRNDLPTTDIKNMIYSDISGNLMSAPVGVTSVSGGVSSSLTTSHRVITVTSGSTFFLNISAMENKGQVLYLKRDPASPGAGNVQVQTSGTLIDNASFYTLTSASSGVVLAFNHLLGNWYVIAKL